MKHKYNIIFGLSLLIGIAICRNASGQTWEVYDQDYRLLRKIENGNFNILGNALRVNAFQKQLSLLSQEYESFITIDETEVYQYLEPWIIVRKDGKFGTLHEYGDLVFPTEFDRIETYFNLLLGQKGKMFQVYDRGTKQTKTLGPFESAEFALNGQLMARTAYGFYLPLSDNPDRLFEDLNDVNEDVIIAKEPTGYGLINRNGEYILNPVVDTISYLRDNHFFAHDGNQYMLIKTQTNSADIKYTSYHRIAMEDGVLVEYIHGKLRRIMKGDGILLDIVGMTSVQKANKNHYNVYFRDNTLGLLNPNGKWEVKPSSGVEQLLPGQQGLFGASIKGKYGYVDYNGQVVIPPQYEEVRAFSEGLAAVRLGHTWGYTNLNGELSIVNQFDDAGDFYRGLAIVRKGGKSNLINREGTELLDTYYDRISLTDDNYYLTEDNGKYGIVSPMGEEITPPKYEEIRREEHDRILVRANGRYGVIKENGDISLPLYYTQILFDGPNKKILAKHDEPLVFEKVEEDKRKRKKGA